ncbi:hypothetical protein TIFTF001_022611 [Ficus carica]|uniref:Uncharacterized protein n=1 Tax=Ficus carica TaxID=3494 RepID=A0AA88AZL4_FICCA|nr:hypothetical protein TIFTF001_022611 [Ficus carica]
MATYLSLPVVLIREGRGSRGCRDGRVVRVEGDLVAVGRLEVLGDRLGLPPMFE